MVEGRQLRKRAHPAGFWQGVEGGTQDEKGSLQFEPLQLPCEAAVIWLHGYEDGPEEWANVMAGERSSRPSWTWVHLRARNVRQACYDGQPVQAWASFTTDDIVQPGGADYDSTERSYATTVALIHRTINTLRERHNLPAARIALGGFSQGGASVAAAALSYTERLGEFRVDVSVAPVGTRTLHTAPKRRRVGRSPEGASNERLLFFLVHTTQGPAHRAQRCLPHAPSRAHV